MKNNKITRRGFFSLNLKNNHPTEAKIQMLTAEGKLVEVPQGLIEKNRTGKKVSNQELLSWRKVNNQDKT